MQKNIGMYYLYVIYIYMYLYIYMLYNVYIYIHMIGLYGPNGTLYMTLQSRDTPEIFLHPYAGLRISVGRRSSDFLPANTFGTPWFAKFVDFKHFHGGMVEYCFFYQEKKHHFFVFRDIQDY